VGSGSTRRLSVPQQARGEKEQRSNKGKERVERYSNQAQGEGNQPKDWQKNQGQQRQRPAQHQQNAPSNKQNENSHSINVPACGFCFACLTFTCPKFRHRYPWCNTL